MSDKRDIWERADEEYDKLIEHAIAIGDRHVKPSHILTVKKMLQLNFTQSMILELCSLRRMQVRMILKELGSETPDY